MIIKTLLFQLTPIVIKYLDSLKVVVLLVLIVALSTYFWPFVQCRLVLRIYCQKAGKRQVYSRGKFFCEK